MRQTACEQVTRWMLVCGILGGGHPPEVSLALGGGVQMAISRSIRVTCVAEIHRIDILFVGLVFVTIVLGNVRSTGAFVYCIRRSL